MDQQVDLARLVNKTPVWSFDVTTGQYRNNATGLPLSDEELRRAVELVVAGAKVEAALLLASLAQGALTVGEWQERMESLVAALHTAASAAGAGGVPGVVGEATADLRAAIAREHAHLAGFTSLLMAYAGGGLLAALAVDQKRDEWAARAASYMDAGLMTFERARYYLMVFLDYTEAQRVLHRTAEHCNGCEVEAGKGWRPIAELKPLGGEECGQWCACTIDYRRIIPMIPVTRVPRAGGI